jgi:hypothetical protein
MFLILAKFVQTPSNETPIRITARFGTQSIKVFRCMAFFGSDGRANFGTTDG